MIAFEAATPFQIFNCINILNTNHHGENADLFLYAYASNIGDIAKHLNETDIFENIHHFTSFLNFL